MKYKDGKTNRKNSTSVVLLRVICIPFCTPVDQDSSSRNLRHLIVLREAKVKIKYLGALSHIFLASTQIYFKECDCIVDFLVKQGKSESHRGHRAHKCDVTNI